jgi:hypothetical protein
MAISNTGSYNTDSGQYSIQGHKEIKIFWSADYYYVPEEIYNNIEAVYICV